MKQNIRKLNLCSKVGISKTGWINAYLLNIIWILSTRKKASKLSFCYRLKIYVLMISKLAFVFRITRTITFSAVKKVSFPQS